MESYNKHIFACPGGTEIDRKAVLGGFWGGFGGQLGAKMGQGDDLVHSILAGERGGCLGRMVSVAALLHT